MAPLIRVLEILQHVVQIEWISSRIDNPIIEGELTAYRTARTIDAGAN